MSFRKRGRVSKFPKLFLFWFGFFFPSEILIWAEFEDSGLLLMVAKCFRISVGHITGPVFYLYTYFHLGNHGQSGNPNVKGFIITSPQIIQ